MTAQHNPPRHPTLLAALTYERHWTIDDFRARFAEASTAVSRRRITVSETTALQWRAGRSRPRPVACRVLEHMFGRDVNDLLTVSARTVPVVPPAALEAADAELSFGTHGQRGDTAPPGTARTPRYAPATGVALVEGPAGTAPPGHEEATTDTDRRRTIETAAAALFTTATGTAGSATERILSPTASPGASNATQLAEQALQTVAASYLDRSPVVTLGRVNAVREIASGVLDQYTLRLSDQARVWRVSAVATGMRAWLLRNIGDDEGARHSLRQVYQVGQFIDDDSLIAWACYMLATIDDSAGNSSTAERHALDGLAHARPGSALRAELLVILAMIRATRHDIRGVDGAVKEAETVLTGLSTDQHGAPGRRIIIDAFDTFSPADFATTAGAAYARLGALDRFLSVAADARAVAERDPAAQIGPYLALSEATAVIRSERPDLDRVAALTRDGMQRATPYQTAHVRAGITAMLKGPHSTDPAIIALADEVRAWRAERATRPASTELGR